MWKEDVEAVETTSEEIGSLLPEDLIVSAFLRGSDAGRRGERHNQLTETSHMIPDASGYFRLVLPKQPALGQRVWNSTSELANQTEETRW